MTMKPHYYPFLRFVFLSFLGNRPLLTGIFEPKVSAKPIKAWDAEVALFDKNHLATILVDKDKSPRRVFFVRRKGDVKNVGNKLEPVDKEDYFRIVYHENQYADELGVASTVPKEGLLSPKWTKRRSTIEKNKEDLEVVTSIITHLGSVLKIATLSAEGALMGHWTKTEQCECI